MTTYSYKIVLDDSESLLLEAALKLMMTQCQEKLDAGMGAHWLIKKHSAQSILDKLYKIMDDSSEYFTHSDFKIKKSPLTPNINKSVSLDTS